MLRVHMVGLKLITFRSVLQNYEEDCRRLAQILQVLSESGNGMEFREFGDHVLELSRVAEYIPSHNRNILYLFRNLEYRTEES